MNNQDILFASLMGSKAVEQLQKTVQLNGILYDTVLPAIPFLPFKNKDSITQITETVNGFNWQANKPLIARDQYFPLTFSFDRFGAKWLFPYEPLISISGKNQIIKRRPLKGTKGTIKEHWNSDDYEINITGSLFGLQERGEFSDCFPRGQIEQLLKYLTKCAFIYVTHPMLELLDINRIVIEDYTFPFTKGENVQAYTIRASSDISSHNLDMHSILTPIK